MLCLLHCCSVRLCVWCVYPRDCAPFGRLLAHFVRLFVAHFIRFVVLRGLVRSRFLTALRAFFSFFLRSLRSPNGGCRSLALALVGSLRSLLSQTSQARSCSCFSLRSAYARCARRVFLRSPNGSLATTRPWRGGLSPPNLRAHSSARRTLAFRMA